MKYRIRSRKSNLGKRAGQTVYYAAPEAIHQTTLKELSESIQRRTALSDVDVEMSIRALSHAIQQELLMGHSVQLGELGSFTPQRSARYMNSPEEVTTQTLGAVKLTFTPNRQLVNTLQNMVIRIDHTQIWEDGAKGSHR